MMFDKQNMMDRINSIQSEFDSFEKEKEESQVSLEGEKRKLIRDLKSGAFEEMLNRIEERKEKKESLLDKLLKLF